MRAFWVPKNPQRQNQVAVCQNQSSNVTLVKCWPETRERTFNHNAGKITHYVENTNIQDFQHEYHERRDACKQLLPSVM